MNCRDCRERLLEVDPRVLDAALIDQGDPVVHGPDDPQVVGLPDHLRTCPSCREAAERVLAAQDRLAAGLAALVPARSLEEAAVMAVRESARRRSRLRRVSWTAAAAAMAGVLALRVLGFGGGVVPEPIEVTVSPAGSRLMPEVEAMLDESVLVLETDNEDVVVFWFYQRRGE